MEFNKNDVADLYKRIGANVKKLRESNGMTQLTLSLEMGYKSVSLVSSAELYAKGKHFNIEHLYKISKIFNVEMSYFFIDD